MLKRLLPLLFLSLSTLGLCAQEVPGRVAAYFDFKYFQVPEEGRMIETYTKIVGNSVEYLAIDDSTTQAQVNLKLIISDGDKVIDFSNSSVKSPKAISGYQPDFIDIQRFILPKGKYTIELAISDLNRSNEGAVTLNQPISVEYDITSAAFSDIELVAGLKKSSEGSTIGKSGLDMIPYMSNLYSTEFGELLFYFELYNMDKELGIDEPFLLQYSIKDANNEQVQEGCEKLARKKASPVITELGRFSLENLRSGAYMVHIEARDRENKLITEQKLPIVRQNADAPALTKEQIDLTFVGTITDKDSLSEYIHSLSPIALDKDLVFIDQQMKNRTLMELKSWFYSFWEEREPIDPSKGWADYKMLVAEAQEEFGTRNKRGYRTDMGRVYCKYGRPNSVVDDAMDAESYPFQIWHYYKAGVFSGGRFVFYDTSLMMSDYALLHSDVIGERKNPRWNRVIHSRNNAMNSYEQTNSNSDSGRRLQELYDSPR